ncbi:MAG: RIO1 family regulatory kinase/ATPase [Chloroflexota bacterium]
MSKNQLNKFYAELDEVHADDIASAPGRTAKKRQSRRAEMDARLFIRAQEAAGEFKFTYKAARFEEAWLLDSLEEIAGQQLISDVLRKVKAGKEASVYLCRSGASIEARLLAAKVYRPRTLRNLKNDALYRTGRIDLGEDGSALFREADVNAIIKRTKYGEELRHTSWIAYEFTTLEKLYAAGADVPKPYAMLKNSILMEYIGDDGMPAPTLNSVTLDRDEAHELFDRVVLNLNLLLQNERIHGDLSAYNILYWDGGITLIDFPQVVSPESNPMAWTLFQRDVTRVCQYFQAQGVKVNAGKLAAELWTSHGHKIIKEVHPSDLDAENLQDRKIWEKQQKG